MIEMLPAFTVSATITAATATAATAHTARTHPRGRNGSAVRGLAVSVSVLMAGALLLLRGTACIDLLSAVPGPRSLGKLPSSPPQDGFLARFGRTRP